MEVYLDLVVLINFIVDFFLLVGTNRLSGFPMEPARCSIAAAFGGMYSGACMIRGFQFLGSALWRGVSLIFISLTAFGCNSSTKKRAGIFIILSFALGGAAFSLGTGKFCSLALLSVGVFLVCRMIFGEAVASQTFLPITLSFRDRCVSLIALQDTGNTLRDPISGEPVVLISSSAAQRLTGLTTTQLSDPLGTLSLNPIPGLRLIPYRAVGMESGMLLAMRLNDVKVGKEVRSMIVGFAPEGLGGDYQALIGV